MRWRPNRRELAVRLDPRDADRIVRFGRDLAYVVIVLGSWLVLNLLAVLGAGVAFFLVVSGFDLGEFLLHLDNLISRYAAADADRRGAFEHLVGQVFLVLLLLSLLVRGPFLVARLRRELAMRHLSPSVSRETADAA